MSEEPDNALDTRWTQRTRYDHRMAFRDLLAPERRLVIWQFVGVGTLMIGVGVLVWAAVAYYQSVSLG